MSAEQFNSTFKQTTPPSPASALPVVTFTDSLTFYLNGDTARVVHVKNAHTDGDAIIVLRKANVIHMGDTFFNGMYPFIDVSTGGSLDGIIAAAEHGLAISNAATRIIPGHGALATRADLQRYRDMLVDSRGRVAKLVAQKMTIEQVVAAKPLAEYDATFGKGFITPELFLTFVYSGLTTGAGVK
jgi:cyclase